MSALEEPRPRGKPSPEEAKGRRAWTMMVHFHSSSILAPSRDRHAEQPTREALQAPAAFHRTAQDAPSAKGHPPWPPLSPARGVGGTLGRTRHRLRGRGVARVAGGGIAAVLVRTMSRRQACAIVPCRLGFVLLPVAMDFHVRAGSWAAAAAVGGRRAVWCQGRGGHEVFVVGEGRKKCAESRRRRAELHMQRPWGTRLLAS